MGECWSLVRRWRSPYSGRSAPGRTGSKELGATLSALPGQHQPILGVPMDEAQRHRSSRRDALAGVPETRKTSAAAQCMRPKVPEGDRL
jgi:hypothetical protein